MSQTSGKSPAVYVQDSLRKTVEKETEGAVTVLYDDAGLPSFMLRIPRFKVETIDSSLGQGIHPAFMVNGKEVDEIFIGQVNAKVIDGRACSIPGENATHRINFDEAREACARKGKGWHLLSNREYAALVMYLVKYRSKYFDKEWWDWVDGFKIVDGEIFTPGDNDFLLPEKDWPSMGIFFDDIKGRPQLSRKVTRYTEPDPGGTADGRYGDYTSLDRLSELEFYVVPEYSPSDFTGTELKKLARMLIHPSATSVFSEIDAPLYVRNYGERLPVRGGYWIPGSSAGLAALTLGYRRARSIDYVGFRPAFIGI